MTTTEQEVDLDLMRKWVDDLRTTTAPQAIGRLKRVVNGVPSYCCLGRLCEVAGVPFSLDRMYEEIAGQDSIEIWGHLEETENPIPESSPEIRERKLAEWQWAPTRLLSKEIQYQFSNMNDIQGLNFEQIADEIEKWFNLNG